MLEVARALEIVLQKSAVLSPRRMALAPSALGLMLAEDVIAELDSPPFDKSLVDGYALRSSDALAIRSVIEEVPAGAMPVKSIEPGQATRIFTGAPIPQGADAVVMQEKVEAAESTIRCADLPRPGQNIFPRGREMQAGQTVVPTGTVLTPTAFGILSTLGRTSVLAQPRPRVKILATGNELVEPDTVPVAGQIRNSNGPMLVALAAAAGASPHYLGIARDDIESTTRSLQEGLHDCDILLIAGGVSVGGYDLVPKVLADLGVSIHFHQVRMKPGKPLLFGTHAGTLLFGLPGNPVSSFAGFELFVRPALRKLSGHSSATLPTQQLELADAIQTSNDRPTYYPAKQERDGKVRALPWFGSPDLRRLLTADAFLVLPAGDVNWPAGASVPVLPFCHTLQEST